jgi:hypothetical protein
MAIGIGRKREPAARGHLLEDVQIAVGGFFVVEPGPEELPGRIVEDGMEDQSGAPLFEPGVMAAVHLHEHPFLRFACPAGAMAGRATSPGTRDARPL